jgi:hypothetical protein
MLLSFEMAIADGIPTDFLISKLKNSGDWGVFLRVYAGIAEFEPYAVATLNYLRTNIVHAA